MSGEANAYVAELRAENARLREVVRRVEGLHCEGYSGWCVHCADISGGDGEALWPCATRRELGVTAGSTDTGPAPAGAYAAAEGAGDGV